MPCRGIRADDVAASDLLEKASSITTSKPFAPSTFTALSCAIPRTSGIGTGFGPSLTTSETADPLGIRPVAGLLRDHVIDAGRAPS